MLPIRPINLKRSKHMKEFVSQAEEYGERLYGFRPDDIISYRLIWETHIDER